MKNKTNLRLLCLVLAALMSVCVLTACVTGEGENEQTTPASQNPSDTTPVDTTPSDEGNEFVSDNVPDELDYANQAITLLYWADVEHEEFSAADQTGEGVNDAIYYRNMAIEDRLGIKMEFVSTNGDSGEWSNWVKYVQTAVQSGANTFDVMAGYSLSMAATATNGLCYNLLDSECQYLDFDMPWWPSRLLTEATINNKLYFASGDISANVLYMMYVCYVNTDLSTNLGLPSVFELVDNNQWTYDKFIEMCKGAYADKDGSGAKTVGDQFGYMSSGIHVDPWFYGSGALIVDKDGEGNLKMSDSFGGERVIKTIEMLNGLFYNTDDALYTDSVKHQNEFNNGNLLFATDRARIAITRLISEDLSFSIVPFPKFDTNQESYVTVMGNPFTLYGIPIDAKSDKLPMLSAYLETYASESYRQVTPALYEITLKVKYVQEENSARMYDIIRENVTFDIGRIFDKTLGAQTAFKSAIANNQSNWASVTKSYSKTMPKKLEKIIKNYEG